MKREVTVKMEIEKTKKILTPLNIETLDELKMFAATATPAEITHAKRKFARRKNNEKARKWIRIEKARRIRRNIKLGYKTPRDVHLCACSAIEFPKYRDFFLKI